MKKALTPKREKFARLVVEGKSQSEAFREAFPAARKWTDGTVWAKSSALMANGKVLERVLQLREEAAKGAVATARDLAVGLSAIFAEGCGIGGDRRLAIQAADSLAKLLGYNAAQKVEAKIEAVATMSDERMEEILRDAGRLPPP